MTCMYRCVSEIIFARCDMPGLYTVLVGMSHDLSTLPDGQAMVRDYMYTVLVGMTSSPCLMDKLWSGTIIYDHTATIPL